jgi:alpha-tubulin suppressor-like RCC1 family protein
MGLTVSQFKFSYKGTWQTQTLYKKNDIVQYNNAAYVCLQDVQAEMKIGMDHQVVQNNSATASPWYVASPEIYFVDKRPDIETQFWRLIVRGNTFKRGWGPHRVYTYGDVVRYGGDLFMYTGMPGQNATATATINGQGSVVGVTVTNGGSGYSQAPLVTFGFDSLRGSAGAQGYATVSNGVVTGVIITHPGLNYQVAPTVNLNFAPVRNTHPEDPTYWTRVFTNPNRDTRRLYAVATPNMQPLGWTRNNGDYPNTTVSDANMVGFIGADGVPYSNGWNSGNYNTGGRGIRDWLNSWQPSSFTFVDWMRSTDNQTSLNLGVLSSGWLPTPDGLPPRCIQWVKAVQASCWVFNNGEVYYSGINGATGQAGMTSSTQYQCTTRVTNLSTSGWLGETLPRSFNQTKIVKVDCTMVGFEVQVNGSWFALGSDGSLWAWGRNNVGQLGLGNSVTNSALGTPVDQLNPVRIPATFFDNKKIVDFICFGGDRSSTIAIDEDGDLWGWGADFSGELGMGGRPATDNVRNVIPTRIPFDFKKFGGVKKMSYAHSEATADTPLARYVMILTNDGSLFGAGQFPSAMAPNSPFYGAANDTTNNAGRYVNRFTRYITTNYNIKQVENFWILGTAVSCNVFIREKDTGLTYGMGDNAQNTITSTQNPQSASSAGSQGPWSLIRGPRNIIHVTNNENGNSATYFTIMMLDENGRPWGQGSNPRGSLSLGYAGKAFNATNDPAQNPETAGMYHYWPIRMPSNVRMSTFMGQGRNGEDLSSFITDDGQCLYCGTDGTNQNVTAGMVQGQITKAYQYYFVATAANDTASNRFTMHSLIGD